jgi:hypothetical protein
MTREQLLVAAEERLRRAEIALSYIPAGGDAAYTTAQVARVEAELGLAREYRKLAAMRGRAASGVRAYNLLTQHS